MKISESERAELMKGKFSLSYIILLHLTEKKIQARQFDKNPREPFTQRRTPPPSALPIATVDRRILFLYTVGFNGSPPSSTLGSPKNPTEMFYFHCNLAASIQ